MIGRFSPKVWISLLALVFMFAGCATTPAARPMKLVVTGEPGTEVLGLG
jgi:hypothetical protein